MQNADDLERYMLTLINAERAAVGAPPLVLETSLNASAQDHSIWMLDRDVFSHTGEGGSSATDRIRAAEFDLSGSWRTAENIAVQSSRGEEGFRDDVENLHESLMNSPGHRANLLNPDLEYIGIGIEVGEFDYGSGERASVIVTQNFAATQGDVSLENGSVASEVTTPVDTTEPEVVEVTPEPLPEVVAVEPEPEVQEPEPVVEQPVVPEADPVLPDVAAQNVIVAQRGQVWVLGTDGDDHITGSDGSNFLRGGAGEDTIIGGGGFDVLSGGAGADRFVFAPGSGTDLITDFEVGLDSLDLTDFQVQTEQDILEGADQMGKHVFIDVSEEERVILVNTDLSDLQSSIIV